MVTQAQLPRPVGGVDVGIVIALKEEFQEFKALLPGELTWERDETGQFSYVFEYPATRHCCVVTFVGEMNPEHAAIQTERLLARWSPRAVVMLGIAAGIHEDVRVGDVVIASQVDSYLASAKAQAGSTPDSFEFALGGMAYQGDHDFLTQVRNFEFAHLQAFAHWRQACAQELADLVPEEATRTDLVQKGLVREGPEIPDAHIASGPVVGVAQQFTQWLRAKRDRNLKALDMESAGLVAAAMKRKEPTRTLVLRGISDYGDERKSQFDAVGEGALRRYAMRNATRLLWALLEVGVLPAPLSPVQPPQRGEDVPARKIPFIGISVESLGAGFKGRERDLEQLHSLFREPNTVTLTGGSCSAVYAHGGGGMGKSRLAVEYAYRYRHEYSGGVFFAHVGEQTPRTVLAEFARGLIGGQAPSSEDDAALAFVRWLEDAGRAPQLLIFDDVQAESREALANRFSDFIQVNGHPIWPIQQANVRLLLTTRMRELERELKGVRGLSVERLDDEAAVELLLEKARPRVLPQEDHVEAKSLAAEDLGGHPLAISLAGAYLGRVKTSSVAGYRQAMRDRGLTNQLEEAKQEVGHTVRDHESSIQATYDLSFEKLKSGDVLDALALRLLHISSFLAPWTPIDPELLGRMLRFWEQPQGWIERMLKFGWKPTELERIGQALARLTSDFSMLDDAGRNVIIHPVIADYTRSRIQAEGQNNLLRALLVGALSLFPVSPEDFWRITRRSGDAGWEYLSDAREAHVISVLSRTATIESRHRTSCIGVLACCTS